MPLSNFFRPYKILQCSQKTVKFEICTKIVQNYFLCSASSISDRAYIGLSLIKKSCSRNALLVPKKDSAMSKSSLKRGSNHLGWILSGCCFSKKSRNDAIPEESCIYTESISENVEQSADTHLLIPEEGGSCEPHVSRQENEVTVKIEDTVFSKKVSKQVPLISDSKDDALTEDKEKDAESPNKAGPVRPKNDKGESAKPRPNYFVAVQVDNPEIHNSLKCVQDVILENAPAMKPALIPIPTMHITLVVMHIAEQEALERAAEALTVAYNTVKDDLESRPLLLTFEGLSHFRKNVLYADIKIDEGHKRIYELYKSVASCFESHGFDVKEKSKFTAHLTIAKLSKMKRKNVKAISPNWYEDFKDNTFGVQLVKGLQLLRMDGPKDEKGYYQCHKECLFDLPSNVPEAGLQEMLSKSLEEKKEIRQKIHDLTSKKLLEK